MANRHLRRGHRDERGITIKDLKGVDRLPGVTVAKGKKQGRNEQCACGSNKKHKHCCSNKEVR